MALDRIRAGDIDAVRDLVDEAWIPLVRYLTRITGSSDAAQDAAQEALVRLWERRETWAGASARSVLFRIGRNAALDQGRRAEVRVRLADRVPALRAPATPSDDLAVGELRRRVADALATLPPRRREIFEMVRQEGLSYREVADALDVSPQTVANQMSLALRQLRTLLVDASVSASTPEDEIDRRSRDG